MAVRVDKWLWAVRIFKSRSIANDACGSGRVKLNGEPAKPATRVAIGDRLEVRRRDRTVIVEVVELLEKRVSAALAAEAIIDHSPPPPTTARGESIDDPLTGRRERGAGRPTKRDRRQIEKLRGTS